MLDADASDAERQGLLRTGPIVPDKDNTDTTMSESRFVIWSLLLIVSVVLPCWVVFTSFVVVPPGEIAIVVTWGRVDVLSPGAHFRAPFVSAVHSMSTKTQLLSEKNTIPTKEGLAVELDVALQYRIVPAMAGDLYRDVGTNYAAVLIEPEAASVIRGLTSESDAKALYSSGRNAIQDAVREELDSKLAKRGIVIEQVMLKDLTLPASLTQAIELKAQAEQESGRMEFVLSKERQEAERKAIEAQGVADFQRIVSDGISEQTLMWKGIEATERLITSPNTKVIIMGNSKGDLPVIFNGGE